MFTAHSIAPAIPPSARALHRATKRGIPARILFGSTVLVVGLTACLGQRDRLASIDIISRTRVKGTVNGAAVVGSIEATLNTGGGGHSRCEYTQLPPMFDPATFSTHG